MGIKYTKLTHRRADCIGCNACAQIFPERFSMNEQDGKADLRGSEKKSAHFVAEIDEIEKEKAKESEATCPMGIIRVEG